MDSNYTNTNDTTKLIIYGLGLIALGFLAYIICRESRQPLPQPQPLLSASIPVSSLQTPNQLDLHIIEQKLTQLETKIDNFFKSNSIKPLNSQSSSDRNIVSMSNPKIGRLSKAEEHKMIRNMFGML